MPSPTTTARDGLQRTDLRSRARLRALALAAAAAGAEATTRALLELTHGPDAVRSRPAAAVTGDRAVVGV